MQSLSRLYQHRPLATSLGLLCVIFIINFCTYGIPVLQRPDEGRYAEIAREMLANHQFIVPHLNGIIYFEKPPLLYWISALFQYLFGDSFWAVRGGNVLLSFIGIIATYLCTRVIFNQRVALITSLLLMTSFFYLGLGRALTPDCPVSFFLNLSFLLFLTSLKHDKKNRQAACLYGAYIAAGLATMSKGLIGILFPMMVIGLWILLLNRWYLLKHLRMIRGLIIVFLMNLPWPVLVQQHYPGFVYQYFINQQFLRFFTPIANREMNKFLYIGFILLAVFPWVVFLPQAIKRIVTTCWKKRQDHALDIFCFIWAFSILLFFGFSHSILGSYILPAVLPLCLLMARYLDAIFTNSWPSGVKIGHCVFLVITLLIAAVTLIIGLHPAVVFKQAPQQLTNFLVAAIILIIVAVLHNIAMRKKSAVGLIATMVAMPILLVNLVCLNLPSLAEKSTYPIAQKIIPILKKHPNSKVASFGDYFQDLPFYLGQTVIVAGYLGELQYGVAHQANSKRWMISRAHFWQLWDREKLWVVTGKQNRALFLAHHGQILMQHGRLILVTQRTIS